MYAAIYCYTRVEVNRPPRCEDIVTVDKEPDETPDEFRARVRALFVSIWSRYPWDRVQVEVFL